MTTRFSIRYHPTFVAALNTFVENADTKSVWVRRAALLRVTPPSIRHNITIRDLLDLQRLAGMAAYHGPLVVSEARR